MCNFKPLENLKVIDLTEGVAGPYAAQYLGDLGADVIKVERKEGDWGRTLGTIKYGFSTQFLALNRNKRNVCLDFKEPEGKRVLLSLFKHADIVVTSFRPGVMEKYGLGYEQIKKECPNLIYGRISGYGYVGPLSSKIGVDTVLQASSGIMSQVGPEDGQPYRIGFAVIDQVAARDLVTGILSAYLHYLKTGNVEGPVDVSLFTTATALQSQQWQDFFETGIPAKRVGNKNPVIVPSAVYETLDQRYISVAAVRNEQFERLCVVIGKPELSKLEKYKDNIERNKNRSDLEPILQSVFKEKTRDEWLEILENSDILVAPVYDMKDISQNQAMMESMPIAKYKLMDGQNIKAIGIPFSYNYKLVKEDNSPPANLGEHTEEVLLEIGYSSEDVEKLKKEKVIGTYENAIGTYE